MAREKSLKNMTIDEIQHYLSELSDEIRNIRQGSRSIGQKFQNINQNWPKYSQERQAVTKASKKVKQIEDLYKDIGTIENHIAHAKRDADKTLLQVGEDVKKFRKQRAEVNKFKKDALEGANSIRGRLNSLDSALQSMKGEINNLLEQSKTIEKDFEKKEGEYTEINQRIESLLPGASKAALAMSFRNSKIKYGWEPLSSVYEKNTLDKMSRWERLKLQLINFDWVGIAFYILFVSIVGAIVYLSWDVLETNQLEDLAGNLTFILYRLGVLLPLAWLAVHLNNVINRRHRLYEEYNFKENLMRLLIGLDKEKPERAEKLTDKIMENVVLRPSFIIGRNEGKRKPKFNIGKNTHSNSSAVEPQDSRES